MGLLYIVSTPIGNLQDLSYRSVNILKSVDFIITENIHHTKILLKNFSIINKIYSLNKINEKKNTIKYIKKLKKGYNIALVSKAGTPLINDPGFLLVKKSHKKNIRVVPIPGPCAAIAALCASGIKTSSFCYEGFLSSNKNFKKKKIKKIKKEKRTIIFYESPKRLIQTLKILSQEIEPTRKITIARELTKIWEQIITGTMQEIFLFFKKNVNLRKGEIVIILEGSKIYQKKKITQNMKKIFQILSSEISFSNSIKIMQKIYGIKKNFLYNKMIQEKFLNEVD
ncbi:16S rRNA (cytidine(1402)-2'-O)-methyltransferase [Buchnera aphidicola]|uniref:16S rRNA (cytidine(1402)-2'-O)-methyltransferase n=1 Tax=Buchnera aphidicola TaxID=9 RepID=UPI0031B6D7C3